MAKKRKFADGGSTENMRVRRMQSRKAQELKGTAEKERNDTLYNDSSDKALSSENARKAGTSVANQMKQTNFGKFLDRAIASTDKMAARDKLRRSDDPDALGRADRMSADLRNENDDTRQKLLDTMGAYKKGGTVKSRGDGIAQRGRTKGRFV